MRELLGGQSQRLGLDWVCVTSFLFFILSSYFLSSCFLFSILSSSFSSKKITTQNISRHAQTILVGMLVPFVDVLF